MRLYLLIFCRHGACFSHVKYLASNSDKILIHILERFCQKYTNVLSGNKPHILSIPKPNPEIFWQKRVNGGIDQTESMVVHTNPNMSNP